MLRLFLCTLALGLAFPIHAIQRLLVNQDITAEPLWTLPDEKAAPFGEAVGGLACRIVVREKQVIDGQAIGLAIHLRNVSNHDIYLPNTALALNPMFTEYAKLALTGPDGKPIKQQNSSSTRLYPGTFKLIKPGEERRYDLPNLRDLFGGYDPFKDLLRNPGKFSLSLRILGPALPETAVIGSRGLPDGKTEPITEAATEEQKRFVFKGTLAAPPVSFESVPLNKDDLAVHEWGVFTVFNDVQHANMNRRAEWGALPAFFYRQFPTQRLRWVPAAWDKPIVYFYTGRPAMSFEARVKFAGGGVPVVWWPCAAEPINNGSGRGGENADVPRFDTLTWRGWLGERIPENGMEKLRIVKISQPMEKAWLAQARMEKAALVSTVGSQVELRGGPWNQGTETEGFLYYDGLVQSPDFVRCSATEAGAVTLENKAKFAISKLWVVDRRQVPPIENVNNNQLPAGSPPRIGLGSSSIEAGGKQRVDLKFVTAAADINAFIAEVRRDLIAAGLFEPEADALLKIWHKGFFENAGIVAFYILPQAEYDRMLPLEIKPKPVSPIVRVGLAFHPNLEAEPVITERVKTLIQQLDADDPAAREAARSALLAIGPVAIRLLKEAEKSGANEEIQKSAHLILDQVDATAWLKGAPAAKK